MKLAVGIDPRTDIGSIRTLAAEYERAGVDVISVPESYGFDAVSILGLLAGVTERVELMSGIVSIYSRTPALLAMTAAGLDQVSDGRFTLGIGASGPQVVEGWHGLAYDAPLGRTREIIEIVRTVWRREHLDHAGRRYTVPLPKEQGTGAGKPLKLLHRPLRPQIPVLVAALGPKNVELAAEVAEGWIPFLHIPEKADRVWGPAVAAGLAKRDEGLSPFQVVSGGPMAVGADVEHLRELDRAHLTFYVGAMGTREANFYNRVVRGYGWEAEAEKVQDLYLEGHVAEATAALPAPLLEGTSLIGDEAYLRDRLQAYQDDGVTVVQVTPVGADPMNDLRRFAEIVHAL
ncbi:LLM class F420-dependent oxidoreductase [Mumia sp. DW29H23]|uniref:LLM class F420-dependent oxidoreductase n=1 Tax=Mumia sp. DW29H23 TaxID=3421241 RepID=UPI003D68C707